MLCTPVATHLNVAFKLDGILTQASVAVTHLDLNLTLQWYVVMSCVEHVYYLLINLQDSQS